MKMTIGEFINICNQNEYDVDIISDYTDELNTNYVGDPDTSFTDEGLKRFADVLEFTIDYIVGDCVATVLIPEGDEKTMDMCETEIYRLFSALAGNCSVEDFDIWFNTSFHIEETNEEIQDDMPF